MAGVTIEDTGPWPAGTLDAVVAAEIAKAPNGGADTAAAWDIASEAASDGLLAAAAAGWALGLEPSIVRKVLDEVVAATPEVGAHSVEGLSLANS